MIKLCPFCGHSIGRPLVNGITTCEHCSQVFSSSLRNKILSAAWVVRKWHIHDKETLKQKFDFPEIAINTVEKYVINLDYSHDQLLEVIGKKIPLDQSA
jgi:hypothetical protein